MIAPVNPSDPNQPTFQKKLVSALMGGDAIPMPGDPTDPTHGAEPGGFSGASTRRTTEPTKVEAPGAATTTGRGYDTTGLDPNNPIDAIFMKNQYKRNGAGSGFGDLDYWRAHPDQAARLDEDQRGVGHDTPGPGDVGNTSDGSNAKMFGGGGGGFNPLSLAALSAGQQANGPADSILARIMAALSQYGGQ